MTTATYSRPGQAQDASAASGRAAWLMVFARPALFLAFQTLIALIYLLAGNPAPWLASVAWWPLCALLGSSVNLALLVSLLRREGTSYRALVRFDRQHLRVDVLLLLALLVISGPISMLPSTYLSQWLFGSAAAASDLYMRPLPLVAAFALLVLFPLGQALTELPNYFGYAMPRLRRQTGSTFVALAVPAFMLAAQHMFLPLIPNLHFMALRLLMFLPFAVFLALVLHWRPRLLPYLMIVHFIMDAATVSFIVAVSM